MAVDTVGDLGDILGVWAHPDDEVWLSAGLMMRTIDDGHHVTCVTATKGEAGFPDDDPRPENEGPPFARPSCGAASRSSASQTIGGSTCRTVAVRTSRTGTSSPLSRG